MVDGPIKSIKMILVSFYSAILFLLFLNDSFKTLSLYKTLDVNVLSKTVCEGTIKNITCPLGQVINVKYALYVRISRSKCVEFVGGKFPN